MRELFFSLTAYLLLLLCTSSCSHQRMENANPQIVMRPFSSSTPRSTPIPEENLTAPETETRIKSSGELIVIDPGHGGEDFGTQSSKGVKYQEKAFNLATARYLKDYLRQMGYKTVMTRQDDTFISLEQRAQFANQKKPALFISVHYNSAPNKDAEGIEVFYYRSDKDAARASLSKKLAQAVLKQVIINTGANSRGVKHGNLAVIRETKVPAILIEGGFLTNKNELKKIKDSSYQKRIAWGIAQGIQDFLYQQS